MLERAADPKEVPSTRSIRRWCESGQIRARRVGPKLWQVDMRWLKERRETMALYVAATEVIDDADDDAAE